MNTKNQLNSIKLEMLDTFYLEAKELYRAYFKGKINKDKFIMQINMFYDRWNICRLDIRNQGKESAVKSLNNEEYLTIKYPGWFDNGRGCVIQTKNKKLNLIFECIEEGKFSLNLKGVDFRNLQKNRIPIYINYKKLKFNDTVIFDDYTLVWHSIPYIFSSECEDGEKINFEIEFDTIYDYYPKLLEFNLMENKTYTQSEIEKQLDAFEKYIFEEKFNIGKSENYDNFIYEEHANLVKKFDDLKSEFNDLKSDFDSHAEANHEFFQALFLDCEIKTKGHLKLVQIFSQELLNFIVNICEKYNINYWLDYGTLLGAVRHGGYVPWDDDVNIGMFRSDTKKFLKIIDYELKNNNLDKIVSVNIDRTYKEDLIPFIQVFYHSKHLLGSVDIFPYDFIKNPPKNLNKLFLEERKQFTKDLLEGKSREYVESNYFKNLNISQEIQKHMIAGVDEYPGKLFLLETKDLFPLYKRTFNGTPYYCPKNVDAYLNRKYGDYENIPKQIRNHNERIIALKKDKTSETLLKNHIKKLRDINKTFK